MIGCYDEDDNRLGNRFLDRLRCCDEPPQYVRRIGQDLDGGDGWLTDSETRLRSKIMRTFVIGLIIGAVTVWTDTPHRAYNVSQGYGWCYRADGSPTGTPPWDTEEQASMSR